MYDYPMHTVWSNDQIRQWQKEVLAVTDTDMMKAWFTERHDQEVGSAHNVEKCPIRNYYNDLLPHLDIEVGRYQVKTDIPPKLFKHGQFKPLVISDIYYLGNSSLQCPDMPEWLSKIVTLIDIEYCHNTELGQKISSGEVEGLYHELHFPVLGWQVVALIEKVLAEYAVEQEAIAA
jgi:hypothetical protein